MGNTNLRAIRRKGQHPDLPDGTEVRVGIGDSPAPLKTWIRLPGSPEYSDLADLPIVNEIVELPLPIVVLCHAKEDKSFVRSLDEKLRAQGVLTWLDERELLPGDDWRRRIEIAISEADFVLVLMSAASTSKVGFVNREIRYALEQQDLRPLGRRYIIPAVLDDCAVPHEFAKYQWTKPLAEAEFHKLVRSLRQY